MTSVQLHQGLTYVSHPQKLSWQRFPILLRISSPYYHLIGDKVLCNMILNIIYSIYYEIRSLSLSIL